ncbi:CDGSH iron-sulfur domain-containing protein 2 isoform X1 [Xenopus tropicalis]|nr:CDGSH iron-sulfur domain-containing protein 2 isoform X1 [Xenopus tropicalis]
MVLESIARVIKVQLPAYLKRLPIPDSIAGFIRLTVSEWLRLLPFLGVLALLGYLAIRPFLPKKKQQKDSLINLKIQKENPKVVNEINIEDLHLAKAAYCRCWRSKTGSGMFKSTDAPYLPVYAALAYKVKRSHRYS